MAPALGTGVIKRASGASLRPLPLTPDARSVPPAVASVSDPPVSISSAETPTLAPAVTVPTAALPSVQEPPEIPSIHPPAGRVSKRKRAVRRARKLFLRKKLLTMLLGKELASTVHPVVSGTGGKAEGMGLRVDVPVPVQVSQGVGG